MIESITLRAFQRHKKIHIKFAPGVTTLVGDTNKGKSTIFRGIRLVCLNKPSGTEQISHGKKSLRATLIVDGVRITRKKGEGNYYKLDGSAYKAFGMGKVPKDIETLLAVDDVNFQRQMDPPFWFTDTPGQVSRNLNEIVNLEVIDHTLSNVVKEVKDAKATMEVTRRRHHEARIKRQELRWVPEMVGEWCKVEEAQEAADLSRQKRAALAISLGQAATVQRNKETLTYAAEAGEKVLSAGVVWDTAGQQYYHLAELIALTKQASTLVGASLPDIAPLLKVRAIADYKAERRRDLEMMIQESQILEDKRCQFTEQLSRFAKKVKVLSKKARVCPTCGQTISSSSHQSATCTSA